MQALKSPQNIALTQRTILAAEKGVICDVLKLFAEVKREEAIGLLTQALCELVKKEVPTSEIYINMGGPELQVDDIDAKLSKAFTSSEWTYEKMAMRMRASCFSSDRTHMPDRDGMTTKKIAEHFQVK